MSSKKRMIWADLLKAFSIICIIAGHTGISVICVFVQTFHVPIFFFISGYFYRNKDIKKSIVKSAKRNIIPYIFICSFLLAYNLIVAAVDYFINSNNPKFTEIIIGWLGAFLFSRTYESNFLGYKIYSVGAAWFLPAFFVSYTLFALICRNRYKNIISIAVSLIGYLISLIIKFPWHIETAMVCVIFMSMGYILRENNLIERLNFKKWLLVTFIWFIGIIRNLITGTWSDYASCSFKSFFLGDIIISLCGIVSLMYITKSLEKFNKSKIVHWFSIYGQNTMTVLSFHAIESSIINWNILFYFGFVVGGGVAMFLKYLGSVIAVILVNKSTYLKKVFST